jgi:hypothetical protein
MRNILDKRFRENENTRFMFSNFFPKNAQKGHKWRHNMAYARCMLDKQVYMHARAFTRPRARAHARTHSQLCNIYCISTGTMKREHASVLRHTYIVCLIGISNQQISFLCQNILQFFLIFVFFNFHYYTYWMFLFTAGGSSRWVLSQKVIRHGFGEAGIRRGIKIRAQEWRWRPGSINAAGCTSRRDNIFW